MKHLSEKNKMTKLHIKRWNDVGNTFNFEVRSHDDNGRNIEWSIFRDCVLVGDSSFYPSVFLHSKNFDDIVISPIIEKIMSLDSASLHKIGEMESDAFGGGKTYNKVDCPVFFFIYNTDNYYHFLYDSLPYLWTYLKIKEVIPEIKLLMNYAGPHKRDHHPFVKDTLKLLGITNDDILIVNSQNCYSTVIISSSLTHNQLSSNPPRKEIFDVINALKKGSGTSNTSNHIEKIYVSRRTWVHNNLENIGTNYTTRRKLVNEDEVVTTVKDFGFVEVFCENMSMKDKIDLFSQAKFVLGPIGGGMVNTLFCKPQAHVFSLNSPCFFDINARFEYCMSHTKLVHMNISEFANSDPIKENMRVRVNYLGKDCVGEISQKIEDDKYEVRLAKRNVAGWSVEEQYDLIVFDVRDLVPIDLGLNSPWKVDTQKLSETLKTLEKK